MFSPSNQSGLYIIILALVIPVIVGLFGESSERNPTRQFLVHGQEQDFSISLQQNRDSIRKRTWSPTRQIQVASNSSSKPSINPQKDLSSGRESQFQSNHCDRLSEKNGGGSTFECTNFKDCKSIDGESSDTIRLLTCGLSLDGTIKVCCRIKISLDSKNLNSPSLGETLLVTDSPPRTIQDDSVQRRSMVRSQIKPSLESTSSYDNIPRECGTRAPGVIVTDRSADSSEIEESNSTETRIIGGDIATPKAWPWFALIFVQRKINGRRIPECGGTLISNRYVLTAAHCILEQNSRKVLRSSRVSIRLGDTDLKNRSSEELDVGVNRIISHPEFQTQTFKNDIALIELNKQVRLVWEQISTATLFS